MQTTDTHATEADLARARLEGVASAEADLAQGHARYPLGTLVGLSGKHRETHAAWCAAKRERLDRTEHDLCPVAMSL